MSSPNYSFPAMKLNDILTCLSQMGVQITAADIKNPSQYNYMPLFELSLALVAGVQRESFKQPAFHLLNLLPNIELHEESLSEAQTALAILKLLRTMGIGDVTMYDIHEPQYPRIKRILSGIINFIKYREEKLDTYTQEQENYDNNLAMAKDTSDHLEHVKQVVSEKRNYHEANVLPMLNDLKSEIDKLEKQIGSFNMEHNEARESIKQKKAQIKELSEAHQRDSAACTTLETETTTLNSQHLRSPERVKRSITTMHSDLAEHKLTMATLSATHREVHQRMTALSKLKSKLNKRNDEVMMLASLQKKLNTLSSQVADLEREKETANAALDVGKSHQAELNNKRLASEEKVKNLKSNYERKKTEALAALRETQSELSDLVEQQRENEARTDEIFSQSESIRREIHESRQAHDRQVRAMAAKCRQLHHALQAWHQKLMMAMSIVDQPQLPATPRAIRDMCHDDHQAAHAQ